MYTTNLTFSHQTQKNSNKRTLNGKFSYTRTSVTKKLIFSSYLFSHISYLVGSLHEQLLHTACVH